MSQLEGIKQSFKSARLKINAFMRRQRWKEALIFFAFILLALGFWLLQSLQQEYEIEITIPVRYNNIPADIAFTETPPSKIVATVKDKGSVLLNYSFGRSFAPIEAGLKKNDRSGSIVINKKTIESDILKQLLSTTMLTGFEPQQINAVYSERVKKEIPVLFSGDIQTEPGFHVSGDITIVPRMIKVYSMKSTLDTLTHLQTAFIEIKKGDKTITRTIHLQKVKGATFDPTTVSVTIPIEEFTEKILEIPVICTDLPPHYTIRTFPASVHVTCNVPLSRFKELSENDFAVKISFADLEQNVSGSLPIHLTKKPEWVDGETLSPDKIEFILEKNNSHD